MQTQVTTKEAYELVHKGILAFARAELAGMQVDVDYCKRQKQFITTKIQRLESKLMKAKFVQQWRSVYGQRFNMNSDLQLANLLYNVRKIRPPKTTTSGAGSTDEESLRQINLPELNNLLQIRKLQKLRDTYLDGFLREQVNGVIHPFLNLHTARTYRSSSDSPNLQNVPKRDKASMRLIRRALRPRKGHQLLEVDFSGLEVSIAACYHKDPTMIKYLVEDSDMHGDMAQQIFCLDSFNKNLPEFKYLRNATKNGFVFPQFYGDYFANNAAVLIKWCELPRGRWKEGVGVKLPNNKHISDHLISQNLKSFDTFVEHIKEIEHDFWNRRFRVYSRWRKKWVKEYQKKGYFDMYTGFRCSGVMTENETINYPVQGAAFHCLLWSFIEIDKISQEERWKSQLVNQIHDALILDVRPSELEYVMNTIKRVTCIDLPRAWKWINVPLNVEAGLCGVDESWADKKEYKGGAHVSVS